MDTTEMPPIGCYALIDGGPCESFWLRIDRHEESVPLPLWSDEDHGPGISGEVIAQAAHGVMVPAYNLEMQAALADIIEIRRLGSVK